MKKKKRKLILVWIEQEFYKDIKEKKKVLSVFNKKKINFSVVLNTLLNILKIKNEL